MNPVGGPNPILVRYFAGEETLEAAATEYVRICQEFMEAFEADPQQLISSLQSAPSSPHVPPVVQLSEADIPKVRALMERVEAKLDLINTRARKYLNSAGNSPFDETVRRLADDVRVTLSEQYVPVVWSFAAQALELRGIENASSKCVDDVQQYFHDTFVDTTWPSCPRHPNHPLNYDEGSWRCPRDGALMARLGELSAPAKR